jgi:PAS domain S-box-containing protein
MANARVMIVEDEIVVAMELEEKLRSMGYGITAIISSGEAAVERAEETMPDLVLMDIRLHGAVDGIEAAEAIVKRHDIPVIFLTAYADDATLQRAKQVHPFGYLIKPFSETELRTTIEISMVKHKQFKSIEAEVKSYEATIKLLGAGIILTDEDGQVKFLNRVAEVLTGWTNEEAVGNYFADIFILKDLKTGDRLDNPIQKPLRPGGVSGTFQNMLVAKNGSEIYVTSNVSPITSANGRLKGVVVAFQETSREIRDNLEWFDLAANLYVSAALCCSDGEYQKAEAFYSRALLLFERNLGSDDPRVANVLKDLADLRRKIRSASDEKAIDVR